MVGLARSGTTLLASMLGAHPHIDSGPETFFFARLPADRSALLAPEHWPDAAVDYLRSLKVGGEAVHELYGQSRDALRATLADSEPSLAAMLESLTAVRAASLGKSRWVEKTPRHLARLPLIRRTFPDASVLRVVRDPRDVAMSMTRVPFASDSLLVDLYAIARKDRAAEPSVRRDPKLLTVRFEDLVTDPPAELRRIAAFLGEDFDPVMAAGGRTRDGVATAGEWWKENASEAPDVSRAEAWRREMSGPDQLAAGAVCHDFLERHGYAGAMPVRRLVVIEPDAGAFVRRREPVAHALAVGGVVVRRGRSGRAAGSDLVFWPREGRDPWRLGRSKRSSGRRLARIGALVVRRRLARKAAISIAGQGSSGGGAATRAAGLTLRVFARRMSPEAWFASLGLPPPPSGDATTATPATQSDVR